MPATARRKSVIFLALAVASCWSIQSFELRAEDMAPSESPLVRLVRDLSGNDPALIDKAKAYEALPPSKDEEIGYYSGAKLSSEVRVWLATVSRLEDAAFITGTEDKYSWERLALWAEDGTIDPASFLPHAKLVFGPLADQSIETILADSVLAERYKADFSVNFVRAAHELEAHIAGRGKILLSIDDAGGDTMLFAAVAPEIALRWKNKAFSTDGNTQYGVRAPDWRRFWSHLTYSLRFGMNADGWDDTPPSDLELKQHNLERAQ